MRKTVSVVMCTYNGAKYLREQLDSIVHQTYPLHEVLVQDDGSTDETAAIVAEYVKDYPFVRYQQNQGAHGYNPNFFSAMYQATGDYIAISDQDDIWELTKIEKQMAAIGEQLLCTHRTKPFSSEGASIRYDPRLPNVGMLRLQYASILGHTLLFRRELLQLIRDVTQGYYYGTAYDVILSVTAAAYEQLVMVDEVLVHQRRHASAATYSDVDRHRIPGYGNGLYILWWSFKHFRQVKPLMVQHFQRRLGMLEQIKAETVSLRDAKRMLQWQSSESLWSLLRLQWFFVKHRSEIFYAKGKDPQNFIRALLFPVMQVYNYQYLLNRQH
jgi:glycosyltransferase involved in cell wall biosynthesis